MKPLGEDMRALLIVLVNENNNSDTNGDEDIYGVQLYLEKNQLFILIVIIKH